MKNKHIATESITINGEWHDVESGNYNNLHPNGTCQYCHIEKKQGIGKIKEYINKIIKHIKTGKHEIAKPETGQEIIKSFLPTNPTTGTASLFGITFNLSQDATIKEMQEKCLHLHCHLFTPHIEKFTVSKMCQECGAVIELTPKQIKDFTDFIMIRKLQNPSFGYEAD